ncbi:MAG TPA: hypothetical protein VGK54_00085 [Chloroflexota bacterium]|jgi:hypothetical protein
MRQAWLLLMVVLVAPRLAAQTIVHPTPPLDSTRAALRDALLVLRDSLNTIDGAAARLQRDYRQASGASLLWRARAMHDACARSARTVQPTREAVLAASLSDPQRVKQRHELVGAMDRLQGVLTQCEVEFAAMSRPDQAETVRGYANDRAVRLQGALRKYEQTLQGFLGAMGIRVPPLGASPRPSNG